MCIFINIEVSETSAIAMKELSELIHVTGLLRFCLLIFMIPSASGCPTVCTCGDVTTCNISDVWDSIPNHLSPTASSVTLTCQQNGRIRSLDGIEIYTSMKELTVTNCKLYQISPQNFNQLSKLTKLDLSLNALSNIRAGTLDGLLLLEELKLANNKVEVIEPFVFQKLNKLKLLDLSSNDISQLSANSFAGLNSVTEINLSTNRISEIAEDVFKMASLQKLKITNNLLTEIKTDYFASLSGLREIDLIDNKILDIAVNAFRLSSLESIFLGGNQILEIGRFMFDPNLQYLNLERNKIQYLSKVFFEHFVNLKGCILSYNAFHCNCEMKWFQGFLQENESIFKTKSWHVLPDCSTPFNSPFKAVLASQFVCTPPKITQLEDVAGEPLCKATGNPPPTIQWTFTQGNRLRILITKSGPANRTLTENWAAMPLDKATESGDYQCTATNVAGQATESLYVQLATAAPPGDGDTSNLIPVIIGAALGGGLLLSIVVIPISVYWCRRHEREKRNKRRNAAPDIYGGPPTRQHPTFRGHVNSIRANGSRGQFLSYPDTSAPSVESGPSTASVSYTNRSFSIHENNIPLTPNTVTTSMPSSPSHSLGSNKMANRTLPATPDGRGGAVAKIMAGGGRRERGDDEYESLDEYAINPYTGLVTSQGIINFEMET